MRWVCCKLNVIIYQLANKYASVGEQYIYIYFFIYMFLFLSDTKL